MDLHDGTATVNSTPGEGTTFTVRWPARAHDTSIPQATEVGQAVLSGSEAGVHKIAPPESRSNFATDAASQSRSDASLPVRADAPGDRPTVLVVEDNAETRDVLRIMLTPRYHVRTATDGMQGHEAAQTHLPDCIVADVMMPRMDGLEMVAALREIPATACIPVILLTARGDTKHRVSGVAAGAAAFIAKPFHPEVLHAHIAQCLEAQRRLRNRLQAEARQRMQETSAADSRTADTKSESSMSDFEREARAIVRDHFTDSTFDVGDLAQAMAISRSTLYRRARANNAPSPAALVRDVRMNTAHRLLETGEGTVTEVGYAVGYESLSSFSDQFHTHFGYPPSQVRPEDT
jgi:DNA-binding response OmpR family regulator